VIWLANILDRLNAGILPEEYFAIAEQSSGASESGVFATVAERYARKANRIAIPHGMDNVVGAIEIVSPGHKYRKHALRSFIERAILLNAE
jgi:hypothetical protein